MQTRRLEESPCYKGFAFVGSFGLAADRPDRCRPGGAPDTCADLAQEADEALCAREPEPFYAVGLWYDDFNQTTDEEVRDLLRKASAVDRRSPQRVGQA
jgi:hypothetical protein